MTLMRDPCMGSWILHCLALGNHTCHDVMGHASRNGPTHMKSAVLTTCTVEPDTLEPA